MDCCPTLPLTWATVPATGARSVVCSRVETAWSTPTSALAIWALAEDTVPARGACWLTATPARVPARLDWAAAT